MVIMVMLSPKLGKSQGVGECDSISVVGHYRVHWFTGFIVHGVEATLGADVSLLDEGFECLPVHITSKGIGRDAAWFMNNAAIVSKEADIRYIRHKGITSNVYLLGDVEVLLKRVFNGKTRRLEFETVVLRYTNVRKQ